jgi:hypothetical protein
MLRFFFINNQCHNISTCRSIMETICDPCSEKNKRLVAEKYCNDFFCFSNFRFSFLFTSIFCNVSVIYSCSSNVSESKDEFLTSAFKSHHVIDLSSVGSRIPPSSKINCEIHTDVQIDYFCSQHDVVGSQIVSMIDLQVEIL